MQFLFDSSMKSVHRTIVNNETAMQFLGCMLLILPFSVLTMPTNRCDGTDIRSYVPRIEPKHQI